MLNEDTIFDAQLKAEELLQEYGDIYVIEIIKSIIEDKTTDSRVLKDNPDRDRIVAILAKQDIEYYLTSYACKKDYNPRFIKKQMPLHVAHEIAVKIMYAMLGIKDEV